VRRQVHWTRGPSNVSQRIRLTPRNRRAEAHRFVEPITFVSRCPKTSFRAFAKKPVAKGLLLQQLGGQKCSPKELQSLIASLLGPSGQSLSTQKRSATCFSAQPILTHPRASPLNALIGMPVQLVARRTPEGTSRTVVTDRICPPGGIPIQRTTSASISEDMRASMTPAQPIVISMIRKSFPCRSASPSTAWPEDPAIPA